MYNLKNIKKLGIMGGSFNPIHYGHLVGAEYALEKYALDKILFMPVGKSPYKKDIIDAKKRYDMVKLAIEDNEKFLISDLEVQRDKPTYTIDTINEIKSMCDEDTVILFIIGTDILKELETWKDIEQIFSLCQFIVMTRPNYVEDIKDNKFLSKFQDRIYFCKMPKLEISSTEIRKNILIEKPISYLLPKKVEWYIKQNELYAVNFYKKYEKQIEILKQNLNENRFNHSIEVSKTAKKLAIEHNEDIEKAFIGGLLHDCCKCYSLEQIYQTEQKYGFELDEALKKQPEIAHGFLGYYVAKDIYGIEDLDILNSIKHHTTGRKNMSKLEKIIYIADYIEPTRAYFKGIDKARDLAYKNLDEAMEYILKSTIDFNLKKQRNIHYLSLEAYDYYSTRSETNE